MRYPGVDMIVEQWIRLVPGFATTNIANRIPRDDSGKITMTSWGDRLVFVTGSALANGAIDLGTQDGSFTAIIDCWARPQNNSNKVPWERAAAAVQLVRSAAESDLAYVELEMPSPYNPVVIEGMDMSSEGAVEGDPSRLARYSFLLKFYYVVKESE